MKIESEQTIRPARVYVSSRLKAVNENKLFNSMPFVLHEPISTTVLIFEHKCHFQMYYF